MEVRHEGSIRDRRRPGIKKRATCGNDGFALVVVLFLLVVMAGLATAMQLRGRTELRIGRNHVTATQSYYAAEAGRRNSWRKSGRRWATAI